MTRWRCYGACSLLGFIAALIDPGRLHADLRDPLNVDDAELSTDDRACADRGTLVLALTRHHALHLCEDDRVRRTFPLRVGRGGSGKTAEGDKKTPVGRYPLGTPRPSAEFVVFIPIEYPTQAQRALGFTGSAIGLHGPARARSRLSPLERATDWTEGCLAVDTAPEIRKIQEWVRSRAPIDIVIE